MKDIMEDIAKEKVNGNVKEKRGEPTNGTTKGTMKETSYVFAGVNGFV